MLSKEAIIDVVLWLCKHYHFGGHTKAPWHPGKDLKGILTSELLLDKPSLLPWHNNHHAALLISLLSLTLHMGADSCPSPQPQHCCCSKTYLPAGSVRRVNSLLTQLHGPASFSVPHRGTPFPTAALMALIDTWGSWLFQYPPYLWWGEGN